MNEIEFIDRLKHTPFSREEYLRIGLDDDFINKKISSYNPIRREQVRNVDADDPVIRLVLDYDVSNTEIGMVWFGFHVTEMEDFLCVGKFEADFLCVSKLSKEVVVVPFDNPLAVTYRCAQNSFLFLEAMIVAARFLENCGIDDNLYHDQKTICAMAENCSELAGGKVYLDFYKVLLGCG
jgi:hypothetical protein